MFESVCISESYEDTLYVCICYDQRISQPYYVKINDKPSTYEEFRQLQRVNKNGKFYGVVGSSYMRSEGKSFAFINLAPYIIIETNEESEKESKMKKMTFLEALNYCKETGNSVTKERYSKEAQENFQWYFNKEGVLVCQNNDYKPASKNIAADYWTDIYIPYTGKYEQWHKINQKKFDRYNELKIEVEPLLNVINEYETLKRELGIK